MTKLTELERDFLNSLVDSDFCEFQTDIHNEEDSWVANWVCKEFGYDMKVTRGIMTSLQQKDIVNVGKPERLGRNTKATANWVSIKSKYVDFKNFCLNI
tara:strand:+ start:2350 stop:2646 length:297 start_codon:yes stop_codon:yes gene_type:complete